MSPLAVQAALESIMEVLADGKMDPRVARSVAKIRVSRLLDHVTEYVIES